MRWICRGVSRARDNRRVSDASLTTRHPHPPTGQDTVVRKSAIRARENVPIPCRLGRIKKNVDKEDWNCRYQGDDLLWTERPNRFLVTETEGLATGRALDLACGEGRNSVWLAEQGWQVTGVDFADVALEKARHLAEDRGVRVDWVGANLLEYAPPTEAFELVIAFYLQMPIKLLRPIFARAAGAVAPGGTFLIVAHDPSNLTHGYGGPRDPAVLYTTDDVLPALAGLEIERAEPVVRTVETAEGAREAVDALVRARRPRR
jgi:SAM-dependent methyltransferase